MTYHLIGQMMAMVKSMVDDYGFEVCSMTQTGPQDIRVVYADGVVELWHDDGYSISSCLEGE